MCKRKHQVCPCPLTKNKQEQKSCVCPWGSERELLVVQGLEAVCLHVTPCSAPDPLASLGHILLLQADKPVQELRSLTREAIFDQFTVMCVSACMKQKLTALLGWQALWDQTLDKHWGTACNTGWNLMHKKPYSSMNCFFRATTLCLRSPAATYQHSAWAQC